MSITIISYKIYNYREFNLPQRGKYVVISDDELKGQVQNITNRNKSMGGKAIRARLNAMGCKVQVFTFCSHIMFFFAYRVLIIPALTINLDLTSNLQTVASITLTRITSTIQHLAFYQGQNKINKTFKFLNLTVNDAFCLLYSHFRC